MIKNRYFAGVVAVVVVATGIGLARVESGNPSLELPAETVVASVESASTPIQPLNVQPSASQALIATPARLKFVRWSKLTVANTLDTVMRYASETKDPDEAYSALQVGIVCGTVESIQENSLPGIASVQLPSATEMQRNAAVDSMKLARAKLVKYCATFRESANATALDGARKTVFSGTSITRALSSLPKKVGGSAGMPVLTQEQLQAAMLVLTQPENYAIGVDRVLSGGVIGLPSYWALSGEQRSVAQFLVYSELTGDKDPDSIRNLSSCFISGICGKPQNGLSSEQYQGAEQVSQQVLALIRSQNWSALGLQR